MSLQHAKINPEILTWARNRAKLSMGELASKIHTSETKVDSWEKGDCKPTFNQAQKIAKYTYIPFGYLFLRQPPLVEIPLPDLRTIENEEVRAPSPELIEIIQMMLKRQEWFNSYLLAQEIERNEYVGRFNIDSRIEDVVEDIKISLDIAQRPQRGDYEDYLNLLIKKVEDIGILVMRQGDLGHFTRPLSVKEFRGFAICDQRAPIIFINQSDAPAARLFTLIHELAHIWIGASGISDANPKTEIREEVFCNAVAAEFLVPREEFIENWNNEIGWEDNISVLETHFRVSKWVIARRALTTNKITLTQYRDYIDAIQEAYKNRERKQGGPSYYKTKGSQISKSFSKALVSEALSGRVLLRDASNLLNIKPNNIVKFARELGI